MARSYSPFFKNDSVVFDNANIDRGAHIYRAILDKNVQLGEHATVGIDREHDLERGFTVTESGITVVPKGMVIND